MAMRILASRLVQQTTQAGGVPMRVCSASMASSSSAPAAPTSAKTPDKSSGASYKPKRESLRSLFASVFGGYVDPADPNEPPIPADKINLPDVTDWATGEEKLFLLAFENGILDPYCNLPVVRDNTNGTKENPIIVESFFDERMVACNCESAQTFVRYMTVYKGEPKRCQCGHWIKCVDAPRFWEKIPKEDLLEITFFRDLEEDGKLDKFLETGKLDEHEQIGHH